MKRNIVLNLIFISVFILFLILSLLIDFFFFIPIICFLPFSFRAFKRNNSYIETRPNEIPSFQTSKTSEIKYCPRCGGEITKSIEIEAFYCYHCGEKLNNN